jgi:basic membrane protein A and related proteins
MKMNRTAVVGVALISAFALIAGPANAATKTSVKKKVVKKVVKKVTKPKATVAPTDSAPPTTAATVTTAAAVTTVAPAATPKSVALMFDVTGRGDKSFNDLAAAGLDKAKADLKVKTYEFAPTGDTDRAERLKTALSNKPDLIICVGFLWQKECDLSAKDNPNVKYAIIDDEIKQPNAVSLKFAEEQGSFLVGYVAGLKTKTDKVGYVGGVRTPLLQKFEAGYTAGAIAANPKVLVTAKYISEPPDFSGFADIAKGKAIANAMLSSGTDIIYAAAGSSGLGVFQAAKESGKKPGDIWMIGVDADQYKSVSVDGGRDFILTSMLKRVEVATFESIKAVNSGKALTGVEIFDLKKDGVGFATSNPAIDDIKAKVEAVKADIISGKIVVPTKP